MRDIIVPLTILGLTMLGKLHLPLRMVVILLTGLMGLVSFASASDGLFRSVDLKRQIDVIGADNTQLDPTVVRSRLVEIDLVYLQNATLQYDAEPSGNPSLFLNLFDDELVLAKFSAPRPGGVYADMVLIGRAANDSSSQVILVITNDSITGNIWVSGRIYRIRPVNATIHVIEEIDPSGLPEEAPPELYEAAVPK